MPHRPTLRAAVALTAVALAVPAAALGSGVKRVSVKDDVFAAKSITVTRGTTVRWSWSGHNPHNVTVAKGPVRFHSSTKTSGTFSRKLTRAGTYRLLCTVHAPDMAMTIRVR
ncbi:MAG: hypothetical protein QOE86_2205 [Solirubrobacteraceae bacterium]|jgi:plastocyanin|nr:hypothetical protein [Solirubrobacteraceae bacterium]